jgi:hypothetical protein
MKANKFFAIALAALTLGFVACKGDKDKPQTDTLKLDKTEVSIAVDATVQLTANMEVTWASSNEAVATVEAGLVKGIAAGEANITAKAGDQTAVCKVTVTGGVTPPDPQKVPEIDVTDGSLADWDALPAEFVVSATCPEDAAMLGLKSVKVYATEMYISILVEINDEDITDREWTPFHVYLDADNSDATGGYGDEFADANTDILCESAIFSGGEPYSYNPAVFKWWGGVGENGWLWTDPSIEHDASDFWGAIIGEGQLPVGASQFVDGKFEIQLLRELLGTVHELNNDEFGIGFDIQQNWSSVGILPCASPTDEDPAGHVAKLKVKINK